MLQAQLLRLFDRSVHRSYEVITRKDEWRLGKMLGNVNLSPQPASGIQDGLVHRFPVRIYYEDTDLSGVVYHANYLRYMERARSDWIGQLGMDQRGLLEGPQAQFFVIRSVQMDFLAPARLGDGLIVESRVLEMGGASGRVRQTIRRGDDRLTDAVVRMAFIGVDGQGGLSPKRLPKALQSRMSALVIDTE
jgi:acyl-CoA thioester hydrolase